MKKHNILIKKEILNCYQYLIDQFGFKESFWADSYGYLGKGFCIGLEREHIRLMFVKETEALQIDILIGTQLAPFENPDSRGRKLALRAWFRLISLIEFFTSQKIYSKIDYETLNIVEFHNQLSKGIKPILPVIIQIFSDEKSAQNWTEKYYDFILEKNKVV